MSARDRSAPPDPGAIRPFDFPEVHALEAPAGLALRVARLPRLPVVSAALVLAAAESSLDEDRAGLAVLTGEALEGGTGDRGGAELAEALESIGTSLHVSTGWDATTVAISCLAERLPEALALLAEVVLDPAFPEGEVERARDQQLARIRQRAMDPSGLAGDRAAHLIYADGVPYGRPVAGTAASVGALGRDDLADFARRFYRPRHGGLILAGDVDPDQAAAFAERSFRGWEGSPPDRRDFPAPPRWRERTVHVVHRPGAVQSEVRIGHPGVPMGHDDHFDLVVANTILGGAFTSRLNLNLRERHGFTYGVRSRFRFRRGPGPFVVATAVGNEVTAPAVREAVAELEAFASAGPTEEEVEAARDYVAGVFPLRMETTAQVAGRIAELLVYGLPEDHHARYRERVRAVTARSAREAAARHVRPSEATVVVVGDAEAVEAPLRALELGPVHVHAPAT